MNKVPQCPDFYQNGVYLLNKGGYSIDTILSFMEKPWKYKEELLHIIDEECEPGEFRYMRVMVESLKAVRRC